MPFLFNYYTLSLVLGGFIALISGVVVYTRNPKELTNNAWLLLNVSSAIWSFGYFVMISTSDKNVALASNLILHQGAILIPLFYFLFILAITQSFQKYRLEFLTAMIVGVLFSFLNPTKEFVVTVLPKFIFNYVPDAGPLYIYFTVYFFLLTIYSLWILWKFIRRHPSKESLPLKFVLGASIAGFLGGGSVFFLTFNIQIPPILLMFFSFYPIIITYAILRHHLFDIRVIVTELLVFITWTLLLIRIILANNLTARIVDGILLTILIVVGTLLIRSVLQEVKNREEIEILAKQLQAANKNLENINQAKSDFLSIASHQLKTPLSIIKGYVSMAMEGMFGRMNKELESQMRKVYISNERLISLVEDLLNLSRIEDGRMKYDWEITDMGEITYSVSEEMSDTAKKKGLIFKYKKPKELFSACVDPNKIRNVVFNLVDNAIKYTEEGSVIISLTKEHDTMRLSVKDTGRGIGKENMGKLFNKFTRAEEINGSRNVRVSGFGLGLYVTRLITEAHKGRIWVESEGEGMGSTFILELPLYQKKESETPDALRNMMEEA
ncbi:MAG: hypothetical protein COU90_03525 [Candidatus Ryanbacteria bacterium CG10_big_fil_rev_8_21_14_0_10_43_42]|uniref:histidine kinase n=1 Tax=Candidatus Ryanbacteria bacterium CG10_big_fil_rev_8_21_14_0_10_43_42 TaxID=1974864 RepID=A0A2M8KWG6_9BACT|nr:MAG: hypothetical protein COU90_03525 [Candidatus Ryanbacteria bacterium CG10_big_fil_rev_8_21_14_0_10_43_42]